MGASPGPRGFTILSVAAPAFVLNVQPPRLPTMTEGKFTPPSLVLTRRLRSLITSLDETSVESTSKQVSGWIHSFKDQDDRLRGLLRLSAELILGKAMEQPDKGPHHVLGRLCKILDIATDGEHSEFLNFLWKEQIQAAGVELLVNDTAEPGSWPEYLALVVFAGELCGEGLLQPDALRYCARMLGSLGSNLGLELACTLLERTGPALRKDVHGELCLNTTVQAMLSASRGDGISVDIRHRVQVGLSVRGVAHVKSFLLGVDYSADLRMGSRQGLR